MEKSELKSALEHGVQGKATLFVGAGFSIDSINFQDQNIPSASPLLELLNHGLPKDSKLLDVAAGRFLDAHGPEKYLGLLRTEYKAKLASEDVVDIMKYPWNRIYTTNYDDVIENALKAKRRYKSLDQHATYRYQPKNDLLIVHLHGFIDNFDIENVSKDCILDFESNIANEVYDGEWGALLRLDITTSDVVVFIGYSLFDPEIPKLLKSAFNREHVFFINGPHRDEDLEYRQKRFGDPTFIGRQNFSKIISSAIKQGKKQNRVSYSCFSNARRHMMDDKTLDNTKIEYLFAYGKIDDDVLETDVVQETQRYVIDRTPVENAISKLPLIDSMTVFFGPLGHGKTVSIRKLASKLVQRNQDVFFATRNLDDLIPELSQIAAQHSGAAIIFEDIFRYSNKWNQINQICNGKLALIASSRINVLNIRRLELVNEFFYFDIDFVKISEFDPPERTALVPIIDRMGMWEKNAALTPAAKCNAIERLYGNNFADLLIGLIQSTDIISRFRSELDTLSELSPIAHKAIMLVLYLEFIGIEPDDDLLKEALAFDFSTLGDQVEIAEIWGIFTDGLGSKISFKSSVVSHYMLTHACDSEKLLHCLGEAVESLSKVIDISEDYYHAFKDLLRFSYLKGVVEKNRLSLCQSYYSNLSDNPRCQTQSLFWLQFGMCADENYDFPNAYKYYMTSYSYSDRIDGFVPFQTDNQMIRHIFLRGVKSDIYNKSAFDDFLKALKFLRKQALRERHGGGGQAFAYSAQMFEFAEKFSHGFDMKQRNAIIARLTQYLALISSIRESEENRVGLKKSIDHCKQAISLLQSD